MSKGKKIIFHLRHNNDVDQLSPIIWKYSRLYKSQVDIFFYKKFKYNESKLILFLIKNKKVKVINLIKTKLLVILYRIIISKRVPAFINFFLNKVYLMILNVKQYKLAVYDWGGGYRPNIVQFKKNNVPCIVMPHGHDIFLNLFGTKVKKVDWSDRNIFDKYIVQVKHLVIKCITFGIEKKKIQLFDSARFNTEWSQILKRIYLPEKKKINQIINKSKLNLLIIMPQIQYKIEIRKFIKLLKNLLTKDYLNIIFKINPRGNDFKKFMNTTKLTNCNASYFFIGDEFNTFNLILNCDVVFNFNSSVGLDAIIQNKPLIYTKFLHKNKTIYDQSQQREYTYSLNNSVNTLKLIDKLYKKKKIGKIRPKKVYKKKNCYT